ncbi:2OG-Fe(II) oxygenase [Coprinopsis marcescibilis]|uniref:2OG-Fe(II) oxygenase n=1 Tax=Coprinopsis marcescibilis TaxID=230819 RepID=A0A5C3L4R2_COPMA|nr:2OG-Fe(II) oxygenase [Coprinopsis marcescibilis]
MPLITDALSFDTKFQEVPVIDLANLSSTDPALRRELVSKVRDACIRVGFFYVSNHGIPERVIEDALNSAKQYFALPLAQKLELENKKQANFKGYSPLLSGKNDPYGAADLQEGFEFGWEEFSPESGLSSIASSSDEGQGDVSGAMAGGNVWPTEADVPGFRNAALEYYYSATALGKAMFPLFAQALDQSPVFFDDKTRHSAALMKLLHYPPQTGEVDDRTMGIGAHTDWECFTILWQQPGIQALQVLNSSKQWINAPPVPGTLVINLGDEFMRITNGVFKSTVHRAVNRSGVERYSIPLFFGIDYNVLLEPTVGCVSEDRPFQYDIVSAGDYIKSRLHATYNY